MEIFSWALFFDLSPKHRVVACRAHQEQQRDRQPGVDA
jgi:hypothetical protein